MNTIRIALDALVINVVVGIFIWPKFILAVNPVETNVWSISSTVGKFANVTLSIHCNSVNYFEAFVFLIKEIFL